MKIVLWMIFLSALIVSPADSQTTFVLNTANAPPNSTKDHTGIGDRVVKQAFERIGLKVKIVMLPSERALINANEGIDDGNFARIEGIDKLYPKLIQVPEPITEFQFVAFTRNQNFQTTDWNTLKPYHVGIITGWKILESNILETKSLTKAKDENILFGLLENGRVDLVVYDRKQGLALVKSLAMQQVTVLEPPLAIKPMYIYLNKKHKNLIPKLSDAIRTMKHDGTYNKIVDEALK